MDQTSYNNECQFFHNQLKNLRKQTNVIVTKRKSADSYSKRHDEGFGLQALYDNENEKMGVRHALAVLWWGQNRPGAIMPAYAELYPRNPKLEIGVKPKLIPNVTIQQIVAA